MPEIQPQPSRAGYIVPLIIGLLFSLGPLAAAGGMAQERYDLYANGVIEETTVIEASPAEETRRSAGKAQNYHTARVYDHLVSYGGRQRWIRQDKEIPAGTKVKVYYSTANPKNAEFSKDGKPWDSIFRVIATPGIIGMVFLSLLFSPMAIYSLMLLLKKPEDPKQEAPPK